MERDGRCMWAGTHGSTAVTCLCPPAAAPLRRSLHAVRPAGKAGVHPRLLQLAVRQGDACGSHAWQRRVRQRRRPWQRRERQRRHTRDMERRAEVADAASWGDAYSRPLLRHRKG